FGSPLRVAGRRNSNHRGHPAFTRTPGVWRRRRRRTPGKRASLRIEFLLYALAAGLLGYVLWSVTDGWLAQVQLGHRLDSFLASHEPATRAPAAQPTALPDSAEGTWAPPPFEAVAARREAQ